MASYNPTAEYDIRSNDKTKEGIQSASNSLSNFGKNVGSVFKNIAKVSAAGVAAVTGVVVAFNKLTDIYGKQEQAQIRLAAAAKNNPLIDGKGVRGLIAYASSLGKLTATNDEALISFAAMGVNMGYSEEMIKKISAAAVDFAAGSGMSLEASFKNLYKSLGGMTGELGESIPALKGFTEEQLKSGAAIDYVAKQYKGMAQAVAQSSLGIKDQLKNTFTNMLESIGKGLAPLGNIIIKKLQPVFENIGKWFEDNSKQITNFFLYFGEIARLVINKIGEGFQKMFTWDWALDYAKAVFDGIIGIFVSRIKFAGNLIAAIGTSIWLPLQNGFEWVGYGIQMVIMSLINGLAKGINWLVENPIDALSIAFETVVSAIGKAIEWVLNGIFSLINGVIEGLNAIIKGAHDAQQFLAHPMNPEKREPYKDKGITPISTTIDIGWADPKLHKKLTTGLTEFVLDLTKVPKPSEKWDDVVDKITEAWKNVGDSGIDMFKAQLLQLQGMGEVMTQPFVDAFKSFSGEFKAILLRELPPEAVDAFTQVMDSLDAAVPKPQLSKWEIFINYMNGLWKVLVDKFKAAIPKVKTGIDTVIAGISNAVKNPGQALSDVLTSLKNGIGKAGISLINKITGIDIETGKKIEVKDGDEKKTGILTILGNGLSKLASWILDMISSTEALTNVFNTLSDSIAPMFETLAAPLAKALMPAIQTLVSFAGQTVLILLPVVESVGALIESLVSPLQGLLNTVMTILQPIINLIVGALDVVGDLLLQIMPAIQSTVDAVANILTPVINFIASMLQSLAPLFKLIGDVLLAVAPVIEAIGYMLGSLLTPILQFLSNVLGAILTPIVEILSGILTVLTPIIQIISNVLLALTPLFNILSTVLNVVLIPLKLLGTVLQVLNPVFTLLADILNLLNPVIIVFAQILDAATRPIEFVGDLLQWLGNGLKALGQAIWYLITFQWNKMGDIRWPGAFESDAFTRPLIDVTSVTQPTIDLTQGNGITPTTSTTTDSTGYSGTGASYGVNTYNVNVTINTDVIAGPGGTRELALLIEGELDSLRDQGLVSA